MSESAAVDVRERKFDDAVSLNELLFQAVGAASMCWEHVEKAGVFDSDRAKAIAEEVVSRLGGIDWAWTIIANAFGGNWDQAPADWREAAERWRDEFYHPLLSSGSSTHAQEQEG